VKKSLFFTALVVLLPGFIFPGGQGEPPLPEEPVVSGQCLYDRAQTGQILELTGRLSLRGNEPFPDLVVTDADGREWYIARENRKLLSGYEDRSLTVRGRLEIREMILADGQNRGVRRILSEIVLLP
jgi:hypothetical protein